MITPNNGQLNLGTQVTFKYGVLGIFFLFVAVAFFFFNVLFALFFLTLSVSLFLSRKKIVIHLHTNQVKETQYAFLVPITTTFDIGSSTTIILDYQFSAGARYQEGQERNPKTEYYEIQLQNTADEIYCLNEYPTYAEAIELADFLAKHFNVPLIDRFQDWLDRAERNREMRRRNGFR